MGRQPKGNIIFCRSFMETVWVKLVLYYGKALTIFSLNRS